MHLSQKFQMPEANGFQWIEANYLAFTNDVVDERDPYIPLLFLVPLMIMTDSRKCCYRRTNVRLFISFQQLPTMNIMCK